MSIIPTMEATTIVRIAQGALKGLKSRTHLGVPFYSFRGIPYARAPVGDLRFKAPEKAEQWKGIRNAIGMPPTAPQMAFLTDNLYTGEEDCLFINVFTPSIGEGQGLKPVLVYIHGGGFFMGSGNDQMHGPGRFMNTSAVVLVTFNYRLGVLGFLSTADSVLPGNNGLKDQTMALRWVRDNIEEFGGDPNNVTIAGVSAGALCTHLHVFSPMSKGLFHKAIVQSGSALSPWAARHPDNARRRAFRFGKVLGLDTDNSEELVKQLKKISARRLVEASEAAHLIEEKHPFPMLFQPVLEKEDSETEAFLPEWPLHVLRSPAYTAVPMITGVTSREGLFFLKDVSASSAWYESMNDDNFDNLLYVHLNLRKGTPETRKLTRKVVQHYFGDKRISKDTWSNLLDVYGDVLFSVWVAKTAKEHGSLDVEVPLYVYQFAFDGRFGLNRDHGRRFAGVAHAADLGYLFETSFNPIHYFNKEDASMRTSRRMIKLWVNFAETGNPTPDTDDEDLGGVTWLPYSRTEPYYFIIGQDLAMGKDFNTDTLDFWYSLPIPDVPQM
ncbi:Esterase FE4 [Blattella germanica]|nr:Esterase FE4 [Blattella germanica]